VPVVSQIVAASEKVPLLSMLLKLDMATVRGILSHEEFQRPEGSSPGRGLAVGTTTVELLNPCCRLVDLLDAPEDIPFLSDLTQREIVYRVLRGPQGERLRAIATLGDQSQKTAKAIVWLKANYAKPLRLEELAEVARMGISTLHHHFRALTAMSPLQYQKQLRLQTARERMLIEGLMQRVLPSRSATRARLSSIASTSVSSVNLRCGTSKHADSLAPWWLATDPRRTMFAWAADHRIASWAPANNPSSLGPSPAP